MDVHYKETVGEGKNMLLEKIMKRTVDCQICESTKPDETP